MLGIKKYLLEEKQNITLKSLLRDYNSFLEKLYRNFLDSLPRSEKPNYHINRFVQISFIASLVQGLLNLLLVNHPIINFFLMIVPACVIISALYLSGKYTPELKLKKIVIIGLQHTYLLSTVIFTILGTFIKLTFLWKIVLLFLLFIIATLGMGYLPKQYKTLLDEMFFWDYKESARKKGDVLVGRDLDTGLPCLTPFKDRFVHWQVIGSTGTGKTSQILLPFVLQDILTEYDKPWGITVLEPKGEFALQCALLAKSYGKKCILFNPADKDCPYFNPLHGDEDTVVNNMVMTYNMLSPSDTPFFKNMNETLLTKGLKVIKRLKGDDATLLDLSDLIYNIEGKGKGMVMQLKALSSDSAYQRENMALGEWFETYFDPKAKMKEHTSDVRAIIDKLCSNSYLRRILNPPAGRNDINFDKNLAEGGYLFMTSAQGTLGKELSNFLGYFLVLSFQSAVLRRPGLEKTRNPHSYYMDEAQLYTNLGMEELFTQGRSYVVSSAIATQNRQQLGMNAKNPSAFVDMLTTNTRNMVIFPGSTGTEAKFFMEQFGEELERKVVKSEGRTKFSLESFFGRTKAPTENVQVQEKMKNSFTIDDIIYQKYQVVISRVIVGSTVQRPQRVGINYIPKKVSDQIDAACIAYTEKIERERIEFEEEKLRRIGNAKPNVVINSKPDNIVHSAINIGFNKDDY